MACMSSGMLKSRQTRAYFVLEVVCTFLVGG